MILVSVFDYYQLIYSAMETIPDIIFIISLMEFSDMCYNDQLFKDSHFYALKRSITIASRKHM
jgi:hypothetical protein